MLKRDDLLINRIRQMKGQISSQDPKAVWELLCRHACCQTAPMDNVVQPE
jgi:hypothetical protein